MHLCSLSSQSATIAQQKILSVTQQMQQKEAELSALLLKDNDEKVLLYEIPMMRNTNDEKVLFNEIPIYNILSFCLSLDNLQCFVMFKTICITCTKKQNAEFT